MSGKGGARGGGIKGENKKGAAAAADTPVGASKAASKSADEPLIEYSASSKPDRASYDAEQNAIKAQIAAKQAQLDKIKGRIADSQGQGPAGEKRKALRAEQQEIRSKTAGFKDGRTSALSQIKALRESLGKKIKDVNNAKSKTSYKSLEEIDQRIKDLERQVESGTLRLVEEKKALAEVSKLRQSRKAFDSFGSAQDSIDGDKAKIEELEKQLEDPEYKALNKRYEAIQGELDELNKELESGNKSRDALYDERNKLNEEINALWSKKKESAGNFKEANDKYFTRVNEERSKRIARQQAERRAYEDNKRKEVAERMLEEAKAPAFEREIEDCTTLISYFTRLSGGNAAAVPEPTLQTAPSASSASKVLPSLEMRQVQDEIPQGAQVMKKKGEDEEAFFAISGGKGKKKGGARGKGAASAAVDGESAPAAKENTNLNIPFQTVAALLQFSIQAPLSRDDVPKTIDALREKQTWFKENQDNVTKQRIAEAEERIRKAEEKSASNGASNEADATADADESKTNGASTEVDAAADGVEKLNVTDAVSAA